MKRNSIEHEFLECIPDKLREGVVYVSIPYSTAVHKCCCGCGSEVVTPLSPTDWTLIFDGRSVSLTPSIGNWSFPCQSHYWIKGDRVVWARRWSKDRISESRVQDREARARYYGTSDRKAARDWPSDPETGGGTSE